MGTAPISGFTPFAAGVTSNVSFVVNPGQRLISTATAGAPAGAVPVQGSQAGQGGVFDSHYTEMLAAQIRDPGNYPRSTPLDPGGVDVERYTSDPDTPVNVIGIRDGLGRQSGRIVVLGDPDVQVDITQLNADITVVPRWPASLEKGGGSVGGVAQSWNNAHYQQGKSGEVLDAIGVYDEVRVGDYGDVFPDGTIVTAHMGSKDKELPSYFLNVASVPPVALRKSSDADQAERVLFIESVMARVMDAVDTIIRVDPELSKKDRVTVTIPPISTGREGAVGYQECAAIMLKTIGRFLQRNPNVDVVVPLYWQWSDDGRNDEDHDDFVAILGGDETRLRELKLPHAADIEDIFDRLMVEHAPAASAGEGVTFDREYFDGRYKDVWMEPFLETVRRASPSTLNDRVVMRNSFEWASFQEAYSMIHKYLQVASSKRSTRLDALDVTAKEFVALLQTQRIRDLVWRRVHTTLKKLRGGARGKVYGFTGHGKMHEIIAAAVGTVVTREYFKALQKIGEDDIREDIASLRTELESSKDEVGRLKEEVASALGVAQEKGASVRSLLERLERAQGDSLRAAAERDALEDQVEKREERLLRLERELREANDRLGVAQTRQTTFASTFQPSSGGF